MSLVDILGPPDMPFLVAIDVTGTTSVTIRFQEPDSHDSPICTKFKVQWSLHDDFSVICDEREVLDMKQRECRIGDLTQGQKYYFRAAAGNLKGYSRFRNSTPAHVTPSSKHHKITLLSHRRWYKYIKSIYRDSLEHIFECS